MTLRKGLLLLRGNPIYRKRYITATSVGPLHEGIISTLRSSARADSQTRGCTIVPTAVWTKLSRKQHNNAAESVSSRAGFCSTKYYRPVVTHCQSKSAPHIYPTDPVDQCATLRTGGCPLGLRMRSAAPSSMAYVAHGPTKCLESSRWSRTLHLKAKTSPPQMSMGESFLRLHTQNTWYTIGR